MPSKEDKQNAINYIKSLHEDAHCELNYANDLELLIAIILSAQTTDKQVNKVTKQLFLKYQNIKDYHSSSLSDLEQAIKEVGLYKSKAKSIKKLAKQIIEEYQGIIPIDKLELIKLGGVGIKTANLFLAVAHNIPLMAVDTHVKRVSKRLYFAKKDALEKEVEEKLYQLLDESEIVKFHHQLIFFGRYHCLAKNPKCDSCQLTKQCRYYKFERKC